MHEVDLYGVVGNPILHSKSPLIFNTLFEKLHIHACYTRVLADNAKQAFTILTTLGFKGANITSPFKETIMKHLAVIDPVAKQIGAVNTVVFKKNKSIGYNTDFFGATKSFKKAKVSLANKRCLVLGAGGAARAAMYALKKEGAEVIICNRTYEKALILAKHFKCEAQKFENIASSINDAHVIISTLPKIDDIEIAFKKSLRNNHVVFDANYTNSKLVAKARAVGAKVISGESWLINQAFASYELFRGKEPERKFAIIEKVLRAKAHTKNKVGFIGFMGSGKSCVAQELANLSHFPLVDTDKHIRNTAQKSISRIFEDEGIYYFRKLEKNIVIKTLRKKKTIIAFGGGAIIDDDSRKRIRDTTWTMWLFAKPQVIYKRIRASKRRPLLKDASIRDIRAFIKRRLPLYADAGDLLVESSVKTPRQLARVLYEEIYKTNKHFWKH